jgi:hypothetical protein
VARKSKLKEIHPITVTHCERCDHVGHVHRAAHDIVHLICPNCQFKWKTISEECIECTKSTGFIFPGLCTECYSAKVEVL